MHQDQQPVKPFDHPENITVGLARVIFGTNGYSWAQVSGWFLPGRRFTTNRDEAIAVATEMNRLMGGVQVVREPSFSQAQPDWAVGMITRSLPADLPQRG